MTGLRKFTTKDLGAIVDAAERYSVGLDDVFHRLHSYGMGHQTMHILHTTWCKNQISNGGLK